MIDGVWKVKKKKNEEKNDLIIDLILTIISTQHKTNLYFASNKLVRAW